MSEESGRAPQSDGWSYVVPAAPARPIGAPLPPTGSGPASEPSRALLVFTVVAVVAVAAVSFAIIRASSSRAERLSLSSALASGRIEGEPGATYSYAWVNRDLSPVRWNPCRPIRWVSNSRSAPPGAMADLHAAIERITAASGIEFVHGGEVDETASTERPAVQPKRYGDRWAPLLITWADLTGELGQGLGADGTTVGVATPVAVSTAGKPGVLVTGQIVLERDVVVSPGFLTTRSQGAVMLHELSHVLGLGHTDDNGQLLYEGGEPIAGTGELGRGDLAGLVAVGRAAGCLDEPEPEDVD